MPTNEDKAAKGRGCEESSERLDKGDTQNVSEKGAVKTEDVSKEEVNESDKGDKGDEHNRKNGTETEEERTKKEQDVKEKNGIEIEDPVCITLEFYRLVINEGGRGGVVGLLRIQALKSCRKLT